MTSQEIDNAGDRSSFPVGVAVCVAMCLTSGTLGWGMRGRAADREAATAYNRGVLQGCDETLKGLVRQGILHEAHDPGRTNIITRSK